MPSCGYYHDERGLAQNDRFRSKRRRGRTRKAPHVLHRRSLSDARDRRARNAVPGPRSQREVAARRELKFYEGISANGITGRPDGYRVRLTDKPKPSFRILAAIEFRKYLSGEKRLGRIPDRGA